MEVGDFIGLVLFLIILRAWWVANIRLKILKLDYEWYKNLPNLFIMTIDLRKWSYSGWRKYFQKAWA